MNDMQQTCGTAINCNIAKFSNQSLCNNNNNSCDTNITIADIKNLTVSQLQRKSKDFLLGAVDILLTQNANDLSNHNSYNSKDDLSTLLSNIKVDINNAMQEVNNKLAILTDELLTFKLKYEKLETKYNQQAEEFVQCKQQLKSIDTKSITIKSELTKSLNEISLINDRVSKMQLKIDKLENNENRNTDMSNNHANSQLRNGVNIQQNEKAANERDHQYQLIVSGLPEALTGNLGERNNMDLNEINKVLVFLEASECKVVNLFRIGKKIENKTRKLVIKLQSVWDARKIYAKAKEMKNYNIKNIFINRDLPADEKLKENNLLKIRRELILAGASRQDIKIRNFKIYNKGVEIPVKD